jgi:SET domain-containing protein
MGMLLVRVRLDLSPIHGIGVFAAEPIAQGAEVWRFTPGFDLDLDPARIESQPEHLRERLLHYGYVDPRLERYILCCDDARFINHSDTPNLRPDLTRDPYGIDIATRDIAAGEELTLDYAVVEGQAPQG